MDYEKLYKEAFERAKGIHTFSSDIAEIKRMEQIFPELAESENERIRKAQLDYWRSVGGKEWHGVPVQETIAWLEKQCEQNDYDDNIITRDDEILQAISVGLTDVAKDAGWSDFGGIPIEDIMDWIEKQVWKKEYTFKSLPRLLDMIEPTSKAKAYCQKLIDTLINEGYAADAKIVCECLRKMCGEKIALATMDEKQVEQNPDDIIESKFKIGDFIVNDYCFGKVIEITNDAYLLDTGQGIPFSCEHNAHLWTIEDAKDGDVLVASDGSLFIFAKVKDNCAYYHFSLCKNGSMEISDGKHAWETASSCHPATKEQRALLFQKMYEAGYEWDKEKKELRKIEQVFAWSEEDETVLNNLIYALANDRIGNDRDEYISWLKSLKQRMI